MAIWQYQVILLPEEVLFSREKMTGKQLLEQYNSGTISWRERALHISTLSSLFGCEFVPEQWSNSVWRYGHEDGDKVTVYTDDADTVEAVEAEIDGRGSFMFFINKLVKFSSENKCKLIVIPGKIISPTVSELLSEFRGSNAWTYARDPEEVIRRMTLREFPPEPPA